MIVQINLLHWIIWLVGAFGIWKYILPDSFKIEVGMIGGWFIILLWSIACILFFHFSPGFHFTLTLTL